MDQWIVVYTSVYPHEIHLAKNLLETEGIDAILKDEMTVQVNNFYSNAVGGVKLMVRSGDLEKSIALLKEGGYIHGKGDFTQDKTEVVRTNNRACCPYCGSDQIQKKKEPDAAMVILYFIFSFLLPIFKPTYRCWDCGKSWKFRKP